MGTLYAWNANERDLGTGVFFFLLPSFSSFEDLLLPTYYVPKAGRLHSLFSDIYWSWLSILNILVDVAYLDILNDTIYGHYWGFKIMIDMNG